MVAFYQDCHALAAMYCMAIVKVPFGMVVMNQQCHASAAMYCMPLSRYYLAC